MVILEFIPNFKTGSLPAVKDFEGPKNIIINLRECISKGMKLPDTLWI